MTPPGPIRVAMVDVDQPLCELDRARGADTVYTGAWVLACRNGHPIGSVELPFTEAKITPQELREQLRDRLNGSWDRPRPTGTVALPKASVVVPCAFSRPEQIQRCVTSLLALDYPDFEVIVVDNRPLDTPPVELRGVTIVREPRPGISAARNAGTARARGEIIAFTDDDVEVDRRWLRAIGERFSREPALAGVSGLVVPRELETPAQIWFEQSGSGLDRAYSPLTFERHGRFGLRRHCHDDGSDQISALYQTGELGLGSNMAFRAAALREAGGFDCALGVGTPTHGGEDLAMQLELLSGGRRLGYEPSAIVHHTHRSTLEDLERQIYGYGVGFTAMLTAIALRHPRHLAGLAAVIPAWLRSLRDPASPKRARRAEDYPEGLGARELRGMALGPLAYLRARRRQRRWPG